ncbi:aspartate/glutamate racemase family protein [Streptomyces sp. HNM0574]|uniref:aspartate/glutamate racemase family protein n=1 Tax=Streptomyces sp. HNM0574 TaxID=2714954 RepID=UPI00146E05BA|nr:aspartate/glutamate racemase family protein [Streptomyces sp. HNM0574]NLU68367.1 hydantoin racemase [Streptomyces sp. HNM0574]
MPQSPPPPRAAGRTVLLVNPNTNRDTTALMAGLARQRLAPAGLTVEGLTAERGPSMITDPAALRESARHVLDVVRRRLAGPEAAPPAALIVAAVGDPAREQLAARLDIPVVGIGQAAVLTAAAGGRRFGMATSTPALVGSLTGLVARHGALDTFTGVRLTASDPLALAASAERQYRELAAAARSCVEQDGAEAVIVAGGPLSGAARRLAALGTVETVEPVPSAAALTLAALGAE